ncbi:MAG: hypothetical protein NZ455_03135 [Bacteroidia bacterium]|nr:hypothetical protein [Bacteroidia bacterium]MDW8348073.1 hypothetical protein [Bacteroidia bacterium]
MSLFIRIPFLGKKLEGFGHQEWLAGHTLIILKIWHKEGIKTHYYALPYTFYRTADKHIPFIPGITDFRGNGYYISYPPFAFYLLYAVVYAFSITPNEVFLQITTLIVQWVVGVLIYLLLIKSGVSVKISLLSASGYFFLPISLRYHTQAYFCDILAQIGILLVLLSYQAYIRDVSLQKTIWLGLCLFSLTFTEWIGFFLCISIVVHNLTLNKKSTKTLHILLWIGCSTLSIFLTLWIYSQISGKEVFWQAITEKTTHRVLSHQEPYFSRWDLDTYKTIFWYYIAHYYPVIIFILITFILSRLNKSKNIATTNITSIYIPFKVSFSAIFLHHLAFLNFTAENDFAVLKMAIPILIICAILLEKQKQSDVIVWGYIIVMSTAALYVSIKGTYVQKTQHIQEFAKKLVELSPSDEVLVLHSCSSISPQVMYYAERNVYMNISNEQLKAHLTRYHLKKAVILHTDWQYNIKKIEYFTLE